MVIKSFVLSCLPQKVFYGRSCGPRFVSFGRISQLETLLCSRLSASPLACLSSLHGVALYSTDCSSVAGVTIYHPLQKCRCIICQFCRSEVWHRSHWGRISVVTGLYSFEEVLGDNPFPCSWQLLEAMCVPRITAPSSVFKAYDPCLSAFVTSFYDAILIPYSTFFFF